MDGDFNNIDILDNYQGENVTKLLQAKYFISEISYTDIIDKIKDQFIDYINNEDTMNYVSHFFNCLYISYADLDDDMEEFPMDAKEALREMESDFIEELTKLFSMRIGIEIPNIETFEDGKLVEILFMLYEYFILNAKRNFKVAIAEYINTTVKSTGEEYFQEVQSIIENSFLTYITLIKPESFLQVSGGGKDLYVYFLNNIFTGNFLRKYNPSLYKNEDFKSEVINYTTMTKMMTEHNIPVENR